MNETGKTRKGHSFFEYVDFTGVFTNKYFKTIKA